jgi:phosphoribosyl-ATP pyrophosphohydrolase/phosphoribosyl-AMP cyclohydrolase/histidinol dehydrogenase
MAPFIPLLDPSAPSLVPSLALIAPLLVPSGLLRAVLPTLPSPASYYVLLEDGDDAAEILNAGAEKVVLSKEQLEGLGGSLGKDRLILKSDASGELRDRRAAM